MQWTPTGASKQQGVACGWRQTWAVSLLLFIIFNFSYKNLDVYQYSLSLVFLLMFFISVFLVFKSQIADTQQQSPTAAKGQSQRCYSRAAVPREGLQAWRAGGARAASPRLLPPGSLRGLSLSTAPAQGPGKPLQPWGQTPCPEPPPRPSAFLEGPRWPQSNAGCPGLGLPGVHCTQHHVRKLTRLGVRSREPGRSGRRRLPCHRRASTSTAGSAQAPRGPFPWSLQRSDPKSKRPGPDPADRKGKPEQPWGWPLGEGGSQGSLCWAIGRCGGISPALAL